MNLFISIEKAFGIWNGIVWSLWINLGLELIFFYMDIQLLQEHLLKRLSFLLLNDLVAIVSSA